MVSCAFLQNEKPLSGWTRASSFGDTDRGPSAQASDVATARVLWLGLAPLQLRDSAGFSPDFPRFRRPSKDAVTTRYAIGDHCSSPHSKLSNRMRDGILGDRNGFRRFPSCNRFSYELIHHSIRPRNSGPAYPPLRGAAMQLDQHCAARRTPSRHAHLA